MSAAFYLDKGVKHTHKRVRHLAHGHKKTVTVVVYTANATAHRVPATVALALGGLKSGTHTLKVVVAYKQTVIRHHGHKTVNVTVTVTKTLTARFRIC